MLASSVSQPALGASHCCSWWDTPAATWNTSGDSPLSWTSFRSGRSSERNRKVHHQGARCLGIWDYEIGTCLFKILLTPPISSQLVGYLTTVVPVWPAECASSNIYHTPLAQESAAGPLCTLACLSLCHPALSPAGVALFGREPVGASPPTPYCTVTAMTSRSCRQQSQKNLCPSQQPCQTRAGSNVRPCQYSERLHEQSIPSPERSFVWVGGYIMLE